MSAPRLLIVNADDLGYDPAVTRGILEAMDHGMVNSATLMVNGPFSEDAARAAKGRAIGLHLNLARWAPVDTRWPKALLPGGEFVEARAAEWPADCVERETLAQLARLEAWGVRATHVDVHKHLHRHPAVLAGVCAAARQRALPVRAIDPSMRAQVRAAGVKTTDGFVGDAGQEAYWTLAQLRACLEGLAEGVTELMCHPGYAPETLTSGYATQREVELQTFTHPGAARLLERLNIQRVDFRALEL